MAPSKQLQVQITFVDSIAVVVVVDRINAVFVLTSKSKRDRMVRAMTRRAEAVERLRTVKPHIQRAASGMDLHFQCDI